MIITCPICKEEKSNLNGICVVKIYSAPDSKDALPLTICSACAKKYEFEVLQRAR